MCLRAAWSLISRADSSVSGVHILTKTRPSSGYGGRELLSGKLYEPNFFGQRYNTTFEAIPGALLHTAGLSWGTALPLATTLLVSLAWIMLAATAYRRGQPLAALLALAAPLLMRLQYVLLFDAPRGVVAGDCAAALAMALGLAARRSQIRLCSLVAIGGLAILWDYAAALAVIPVLVYVVCNDWPEYRRRDGQTALLVAVATLPPLTWYLFTTTWWNAHHSYVTYPEAASSLHWSVWVHIFRSPLGLRELLRAGVSAGGWCGSVLLGVRELYWSLFLPFAGDRWHCCWPLVACWY